MTEKCFQKLMGNSHEWKRIIHKLIAICDVIYLHLFSLIPHVGKNKSLHWERGKLEYVRI